MSPPLCREEILKCIPPVSALVHALRIFCLGIAILFASFPAAFETIFHAASREKFLSVNLTISQPCDSHGVAMFTSMHARVWIHAGE